MNALLEAFANVSILPPADFGWDRADAIAKGLQFYWGKQRCKKGHIGFKYVSDGRCLKCRTKWRAANTHILKKMSLNYAKRHPEQFRASRRNWKLNNPDKIAAYGTNRRARKRKAQGFFTSDDIARIRLMQRDRCAMPDCKKQLHGEGHRDHIKPLSRGGSNWPNNIQLLCSKCNIEKHAKDPIIFARERGLLI